MGQPKPSQTAKGQELVTFVFTKSPLGMAVSNLSLFVT